MQPRGVDEDDLEVLAVHDAADGVPGGLRALRRDRDLGADERVGQRRLAGVRPADEADEAGTEFIHASAPLTSPGQQDGADPHPAPVVGTALGVQLQAVPRHLGARQWNPAQLEGQQSADGVDVEVVVEFHP